MPYHADALGLGPTCPEQAPAPCRLGSYHSCETSTYTLTRPSCDSFQSHQLHLATLGKAAAALHAPPTPDDPCTRPFVPFRFRRSRHTGRPAYLHLPNFGGAPDALAHLQHFFHVSLPSQFRRCRPTGRPAYPSRFGDAPNACRPCKDIRHSLHAALPSRSRRCRPTGCPATGPTWAAAWGTSTQQTWRCWATRPPWHSTRRPSRPGSGACGRTEAPPYFEVRSRGRAWRRVRRAGLRSACRFLHPAFSHYHGLPCCKRARGKS